MKYKLGDLIEPYAKSCNIHNLMLNDVSGINRDKEFFAPAKQIGADTSKYKIVPPNYFACNLMHVGRDIVLPISLNTTDKDKIVSPAYTIFKVKDESLLLSEYLFIWLKSDEKDRYFWLFTDSSIRDGLSWEDMCNIELDLPPIEIQQKYVAVYQALLANQRAYEAGLEDLKLVCDGNLDKFKSKYPFVKIKNLLTEVDNRNVNMNVNNLQGININKEFMSSVANINDDGLGKYKIVHKNQFAYSAMQTGRDKCIRIALWKQNEPCIISPAYSVLKVNSNDVLAEYIMLWFSRQESDRYGWFISDSSIRASLELTSFYEIKIPLPDLPIQQAIVDIYKVLLERRQINEQLKQQIKQICPVLIRGATEEMVGQTVN